MCWSHVHKNILPQLKSISTHNKSLADKILKDIDDIQWSVLNENSFRKSFKLLENKYLGKYDQALNVNLSKFFT